MVVDRSALALRVIGEGDAFDRACQVAERGKEQQLNRLLAFGRTLVSLVSAAAALVVALVQDSASARSWTKNQVVSSSRQTLAFSAHAAARFQSAYAISGSTATDAACMFMTETLASCIAKVSSSGCNVTSNIANSWTDTARASQVQQMAPAAMVSLSPGHVCLLWRIEDVLHVDEARTWSLAGKVASDAHKVSIGEGEVSRVEPAAAACATVAVADSRPRADGVQRLPLCAW